MPPSPDPSSVHADGTETAVVHGNPPDSPIPDTPRPSEPAHIAKPESGDESIGLGTAARRHWGLVLVGVLFGGLLAFSWVYRVSMDAESQKLHLSQRPQGTYATSLVAVVDTTDFGIGRSDTNTNNLANLAPTYAKLLTSELILRNAEASLGTTIDPETVVATVVQDTSMIKLSVEGTESAGLGSTAQALLGALREYVAVTQQQNRVPEEFRLTVRGIGTPSEPELKSNRQAEVAVVLFLIPIAAALVIARRLEARGDREGKSP
jgi:hypothetical protein